MQVKGRNPARVEVGTGPTHTGLGGPDVFLPSKNTMKHHEAHVG